MSVPTQGRHRAPARPSAVRRSLRTVSTGATRAAAPALTLAAGGALAAGVLTAPSTVAAPTGAAVTSVATAPVALTTAVPGSVRFGRVTLSVAARYKGVPYRWGGTTPRGFDCSGYTRYVLRVVGKRIPRTSRAQYRATRHISRRSARPGDLVFFHSGSRVYHVAIYAGTYHGRRYMWHSPHTGSSVRKAKVYSSSVWYGRVR